MECYVIFLAAFAAFGGFMFGYDIGVINGVKDLDGFRDTMNISRVEHNSTALNGTLNCAGSDEEENALLGLIVSLFSIGCLFGALLSGGVSDLIGRKYAIVLGGMIFFLGGVIQTASFYLWMVLLGRVVAGLGVGILSMVVPVYNAELAPKTLRGRLVALNQLFITAGIMVSFCVSLLATLLYFGWRIALGIQCLLAMILITGMLMLPETPRWLVKRGKIQKANQVLHKLRKSYSEEEIQDELKGIQETMETNSKVSFGSVAREVLKWKTFERVLLGIILQLFQQFTGINVIMYYSTSIFCSIKVPNYVATAIVGVVNFLTTLLVIFVVDKVGRKSLLLLGSIGMFLTILVSGLLIQVFAIDEGGHDVVGYIVALLILAFVASFAFSWGPVAWVITSEIFPLSVRGIAVSITTSGNWIGNFVIAMVTPILLGSVLKTAGTFYILAVFLFASFLFVLLTLPETKGESLERIDLLFQQPLLKRINVLYYLRCGCPWFNNKTFTIPADNDVSVLYKSEPAVDNNESLNDNENTSLIDHHDNMTHESNLSSVEA